VAGAARGEAESLHRLAGCYYEGKGVPQSHERAAELYQQAASKGLADAQYNLGLLYYNGLGVPQSYEQAAELWQQAAAEGFASAQYNLGVLYGQGRQGVSKDVARGVALLKQTAAGGSKAAAEILRQLGEAAEAVPPGAPA
jgi:TPR repeat protein